MMSYHGMKRALNFRRNRSILIPVREIWTKMFLWSIVRHGTEIIISPSVIPIKFPIAHVSQADSKHFVAWLSFCPQLYIFHMLNAEIIKQKLISG